MTSSMRGLMMFIGDIKAATGRVQEEQRVMQEILKIKKAFTSKSISGYNRKKYMWKLIYIYMLGYEVDFGLNEINSLMNSLKYSEKCTGYIAISVLIRDSNLNILEAALPTIKNDLTSPQESHKSLALSIIGNGGFKILSEKLHIDVAQLALNENNHNNYIKKKALGCLLSILRRDYSYFSEQWITPLRLVMQSKSFGVLLAATPLITLIILKFGNDKFLDFPELAINSLIHLNEYARNSSSDYLYYQTACPWLQIKLLKLLQLFPPPDNPVLLKTINEKMWEIVSKTDVTKNINKDNADFSIMFEVMNLVLHYNQSASDYLREKVGKILSKFIGVVEPNIRYIGLETLTRITDIEMATKIIQDEFDVISDNLRDFDLAIRKRALDALFYLCNKNNGDLVVNTLLEYLQSKDFSLREEIILKIALLAERFGPSLNWYIDVIIKVLELAGDNVGNDIWYRLVQIVTGFGDNPTSESLQKYAALKVFNSINNTHSFESLVMLSAIILAGFGHLIADSEKTSNENQIEILKKHLPNCSSEGIKVLITSFAKMAKRNPEVEEAVLEIFENYTTHWDIEVQQRACEYKAFFTNEALKPKLAEILENAPTYPESIQSNNLIIKRLQKLQIKDSISNDIKDSNPIKATGITLVNNPENKIEEKEKEKEKEEVKKQEDSDVIKEGKKISEIVPKQSNILDLDDFEVQKFDTMSINTQANMHPFYSKYMIKFAPNPSVDASKAEKLNPPSGNLDKWKNLLTNKLKEGTVYEDANIVVVMKAEYYKYTGRILMQFVSKEGQISDIDVKCQFPEGLDFQCSKIKMPSASNQNPQMLIQMLLSKPFNQYPNIKINFTKGGLKTNIEFGLPILISKFFEPVQISLEKFSEIWFEITSNKPQTFQKLDTILKNPAPTNISVVDVLKKIAILVKEFFNCFIISPKDPQKFTELCISGQLPLKPSDVKKFPASVDELVQPLYIPVMCQFEFYPDIDSSEFRFSLRSNDTFPVSNIFLSLFKFYLNPNN